MIDVHTHILPAIDDGAKTREDAIKILQAEVAQGVKEIVFTPHYYGKKRSLDAFLALRNDAWQKIQADIPDGLQTRLGAEVHFTGVNDPSHDALCTLAMEGTSCVLIELPFTRKWNKSVFTHLREFILDTGYTPIIAHVERYMETQKNPEIVAKFVEMGCLIQVNTGSFLNKMTRRFAYALLKHGLVHCLATDTHNSDLRAPDYETVREAVYSAGYEKEWKQAQACMRAILDKKPIRQEYSPVRRFLRFYY